MAANADAAALDWLLASDEPAIRYLTRRDLLGQRAEDDANRVLDGALVRGLLQGQDERGGWTADPYRKWTGAHWRLVSLVELGLPAGEARAVAAAETVLDWLTRSLQRKVTVIDGRARRCGSIEGNALAAASRLGLAGDERARTLATGLLEWQWPDGGWNCDRRPDAHRSSFHETLTPIWGLHEYAAATGDVEAADAARRGAELLLEHRLFRGLGTGETIHREWLTPHWPPYWHYDVLHALVILTRMGLVADPRTDDALEELRRRRRADGRWRASTRWWNPPSSDRAPEAVDWRVGDAADRLVTLRALTVARRAAGPP